MTAGAERLASVKADTRASSTHLHVGAGRGTDMAHTVATMTRSNGTVMRSPGNQHIGGCSSRDSAQQTSRPDIIRHQQGRDRVCAQVTACGRTWLLRWQASLSGQCSVQAGPPVLPAQQHPAAAALNPQAQPTAFAAVPCALSACCRCCRHCCYRLCPASQALCCRCCRRLLLQLLLPCRPQLAGTGAVSD